ncbi:MAG: sugar phosphate isomerase/epimerase family protein [bacterium]
MKPGFSTKLCPNFDFKKIDELVHKTGFKYIEFQVGNDQAHEIEKFIDKSRNETKKELDKYEFKPWVVASSVHLNEEALQEFDRVKEELIKWSELAVRLGVDYIRIFPASTVLSEKDLIKLLKQFSEVVSDFAVELLLETHGAISTGETMSNILDKAGVTNINVIWDIAHSVVHGESISETYRFLAPYLKHVHIKDFAKIGEGKDDNPYSNWKRFVPFGEGDFPLTEMFAVLRENDFQGVLSVEIPAEYDTPENILLDANKYFHS